MPYAVDNDSYNSEAFMQFEKYFLQGLHSSRKEKMRLFHSRAEGTVKSYLRIVKSYVKYSREENVEPFPVTENSIRRYIDTLDLESDRGKFDLIKPSMIFLQKCRNDPKISFNSADLVLEGLIREAGANFPVKYDPKEVKELDVRKFLLRGLYGKSFREPFNEKMSEFRTALRCLTSLFCLSRCSDYQELKRKDVFFEDKCVLIVWRKRKNNQRSKPQVSILPRMKDHPLDPYRAFKYWFKRTGLKEDQFLNTQLSRAGKACGSKGISRTTCYNDNKALCGTLNLDAISEKMCKSLGTR